MSQNNIIKIIIGTLLALGLGLGLFQHNRDPYFGSNKTSYNFAPSDKSLNTYFKEASELAKKTDTKANVSFLAVGDIMLSRNVAGEIQKAKNINLPYEKMVEILNSTDFNFGNLESPIGAGPAGEIIGGHSLIFGTPVANITPLIENNFRVMNLANNHALDQGYKGLIFTKEYLNTLGIQTSGGGSNEDEAWQAAIVKTANGIKICFIGASYASINDGGKATNTYVARIEDTEKLKIQISNAKKTCDFIVATMHAGTEYVRKPNQAQIDFAHTAIDAGADMVIGAHPHWVQTIERYCPNSATILTSPLAREGAPISIGADEGATNCANPKFIFYSLGNFIFDQMWSTDTREGLTLKINLSKTGGCSPSPLARGDALSASEGQRGCTDSLQGNRQPTKLESVELIPIIIDNYSTPRPATETETKKILEKIDINETVLH